MFWFRKFLAILSVSVGVALAVLPFPAELSGERTVEVVHLEVAPAPFDETAARVRFGDSFLSLSYDSLEAFPELREAVLSLWGESGTRCVSAGEWRAALAEWGLVNPEGVGYAFRDDLHEIVGVTTEHDDADGELACFEVVLLGAYDNRDWSPMSRPDAADLEGFPELGAALARLAAGPLPAADGREVPVGQWRRFHRRHLDTLEYRPAFVVLDRLFTGAVEEEPAPWMLATPWLRPAAQVTGGIAVALGLVLLVGSYRASAARPGIAVAPAALALLCDAISLAGGTFFAGLAIDTLWVGPLGQASLVGLAPEWPSPQAITGLHFVSVPAMLIALPLLTLYFTSLSAQRVQVDEAGVTSHGALGSKSISWQDLERVRLRAQRNPFAFTVVDFRRLQKVLDLKGAKRTVTLNEPASRARKTSILTALCLHVPAAKRALFEELEQW